MGYKAIASPVQSMPTASCASRYQGSFIKYAEARDSGRLLGWVPLLTSAISFDKRQD